MAQVRYTVDESGQCVARDGTVLGRITSITLEQEDEALARTRARAGSVVKSTTNVKGNVKDKSTTNPIVPYEANQGSFLPDPVDETWELYVTLLERPRMVLTPKYRKWITQAHADVGPDQTRRAIRGLAASTYHRDNGYIGLEYAIVPKRGESIEGRTEKMAAIADQTTPAAANGPMTVDQWVDHFTSAEVRQVARDSIDAIDIMVQRPDDDNAQLQGTIAVRRLGGNGYRPVIESGRVVRVEHL